MVNNKTIPMNAEPVYDQKELFMPCKSNEELQQKNLTNQPQPASEPIINTKSVPQHQQNAFISNTFSMEGTQYGLPRTAFNQPVDFLAQQPMSMFANAQPIPPIYNLNIPFAQLSSQRNENPRCFQIAPNGKVESIEPSGNRKPVGTFHYQGSFINSVGYGPTEKRFIRINYNDDAAIIPQDEIAKGNLIKYFRSFARISSKELANAFLYDLVMKVSNSPDIPVINIPEYPGIYHYEMENGKPGADFMYYSGDADDVELRYLPENYVRKMLPCQQATFSEAVKGILPYLKDKAAYLLLAYSIVGFFASLLEMIYFRMSIILIVSAPNAEAESLAACLLKTYEKEKQVLSLTMSKTAMTKTLRDAYGETVVFSDDTTADSNVKRTSAIDTILSFPSDQDYKPHNVAILSKTIHHFIPADKCLQVDLNDHFGRGISGAERSRLIENLNSMQVYMAEEYCAYVDRYYSEIEKNLQTLKAEEHGFESENAKTTFAALYGMLEFWAQLFRTELPQDMKDYFVKCIADAENMETGKDLAIINEFYRTLSNGIASGTLTVTELGRDMAFREKQSILIHDKDLLLAEEHTLKSIFLPNIQTAATVNGILTALAHEGYLVSTNGHRKPTTVYDESGEPKPMKLIAFTFRDMVRSETAMFIDNLCQEAYFRMEIPEQGFIPLVQNHFGKTAAQLLEHGSNQHRFVTGKSGSGKTVFLILLAYWLAKSGNQVVIFDANSSFTIKALSEVLPEAFIREHISFCSVNDGIPVNLLHTFPDDKKTAKKKMLTNILGAGIRNMSPSQELALTAIAKRILEKTDSPAHCDLLEQLETTDGNSENSIRLKLEPLFEELFENENEDLVDWFTYVKTSKEILILTMDENMSENGCQLTDIMLASLYNAQCHEDAPKQLSLIIDEIHNQNLSDESIIARILKEGRKHSIDLNFATQYVNDVKQNRMMKQASLSVYFQPDIASRPAVAAMLGMKKSEEYKLDKLKKGECFVQGNVYNFETECTEDVTIKGKTHILRGNGESESI